MAVDLQVFRNTFRMKKNVLLVDDDKIFNFLSRRTIENMGFAERIHVANNGKEALELLNDYFSGSLALPDVILLDLDMPVMDGFEFVAAFRKLKFPEKNSIRIVIVTSSENPRDRQRAEELGITHYINKPISESSLRSVLEG
jgi:CheY-like chemotaxis protein